MQAEHDHTILRNHVSQGEVMAIGVYQLRLPLEGEGRDVRVDREQPTVAGFGHRGDAFGRGPFGKPVAHGGRPADDPADVVEAAILLKFEIAQGVNRLVVQRVTGNADARVLDGMTWIENA